SIATSQRLERLGQVTLLRHRPPIDQGRGHSNVASKRGPDLDRNENVWIIEPAATLFIFGVEPKGANYRAEDNARGNLTVEMFYEIDPRRNVVDIHEEIFSTETQGKPIV